MEITYDDSRLQKMFAELTDKRKKNALRGAFRRVATFTQKRAASNLSASGLGNAKAVSKSIRKIVFKQRLGFKVSIAPSRKGNKGMHRNRRGLLKPVAYWAESGTKERKTGRSVWQRMTGSGRLNRGKMPQYSFMHKTEAEIKPVVTNKIREEIVKNVERIHRKYASN